MPEVGKYVSPPGERCYILAMSKDLSQIALLDGFKKDGSLAINSIEQKAFSLADCSSMILKDSKGKPKGVCYPAIYEIASGVRFMGMGSPKIPPENPNLADRLLLKLSSRIDTPMLKEPVKFEKGPMVKQMLIHLETDPRLMGKALDNALIKNALSLKSEIWQILLFSIIAFVMGAAVF